MAATKWFGEVLLNGVRMKPVIGITVGDAAGVGPELAMQCAALPEVAARCQPVLYGPVDVLTEIGVAVGRDVPQRIVDIGELKVDSIKPGEFSSESGIASYQAVEAAIEDALAKRIDG
ncbi:MAG TPA: hypothetical protein DEF45_11575, partial [Rhodopirellula sp.]|nr:hypothetical protein [Rhodopirellula sp.]